MANGKIVKNELIGKNKIFKSFFRGLNPKFLI